VAEDARLALEERLVTDPDSFDALGVIEDELTEEYLEGRLPPHERRAFEASFLATESGRRQTELMAALKKRAAGSLASHETEPWLFLERWVPVQWQPALAGTLAAMFVMSFMVNVWLLKGRVSLQNQVSQLQTRQELEQENARRLARVQEDLQTRLDAMQTTPSRALVDPSSSNSQSPAASGVPAADHPETSREVTNREPAVPPTFALTAGLLRSDGRLTRLALPSNAVIVRLKLDLPENSYPLYRAALTDADGDETWTASKLRAESVGTRAAIFVELPVNLLTRGDYQMKVSGQPHNAPAEPFATYSFRVVSQ
jgi:hypothetical protein